MANVLAEDVKQSIDALLDAVRNKLAISGAIYDTPADAIANTKVGGYFVAPDQDPVEYMIVYRHEEGGTYSEVYRYPTEGALEANRQVTVSDALAISLALG